MLVDSLEITELLVTRGAELSPGDRDGVTPLALANRCIVMRPLRFQDCNLLVLVPAQTKEQ